MEETIGNVNNNVDENERIEAIKECYGLDALNEDKQIKLEGGEVITAWMAEGFETFEEVVQLHGLATVIAHYDSGA